MSPSSMTCPPKHVAIIGAGLAGLTLAIALSRKGIEATIYELRVPTTQTSGALMLSPNALRILDTLGLYQSLRPRGYNFETVTYKNNEEVTTDQYFLGSEKLYEYKALRIYRQTLLTELRAAAKEAEIPIVYGKKFSHVVSETAQGVTFQFVDGSKQTADLLVGADGIHSTVRKYIAPDVTPQYSGQVAVTCAIHKSELDFPADVDYALPVAIHGKPGAFVLAPQDVKGEEILAGTQFAYPEQDRAGWDALLADKPRLLGLFRKDYQDWPPVVQSALSKVPVDTMAIWPYYVVPKLERWSSPGQRVIILGDAAHAIPPTAGQGASQGFEDSFTLAALLASLSRAVSLEQGSEHWQRMRQDRIDKVVALTLQLNNARLPMAEREALKADEAWQSGEDGELAWLYNARIEEDMLAWVDSNAHKSSCPFERLRK